MKIGTNKDRFLATTLLAGMASLGVPLAVGVATMVAPTDALAQDYSNGTLSGSVVDATGAPVAGATVVIRSQAQGFERTTTTNANGEYRVPLIPQGLYTVVVSKDGLQTTSSEDLQVRVGAGNSYRIEMAGASEEEIVVTAARRTVEFTQSTTGVSIDVAETLTREPIARNITALTLLAPGAVPSDTAFGIASGQSLAPASISGASGAENAFFLNGLNITNFINGIGGATVPFDFYQTVEVKTGGYQAEFGRAIGGVVNAVSKSGSNDFTAALHINYAPNSLLADRPDSVLRQYSLYDNTTQDITLEVGGPIIPDHLFFYGLGQWQKSEFSTATAAGTYVDQRQGDPFYGFKIDGYITDTQHLELTYFDTTSQIKQELHSFDPATNEIDPTILSRNTVRQGGENYVARYTGAFTDWLTISAAYGRSTTDAASVTDLLNIPRVQDARSAPTVDLSLNRTAARTDPFLAEREFYRGDVDLYFDLLANTMSASGSITKTPTMTQTSTRNGGANYTVRTSGSAGNTGLGLGSNITYIERRVFDSGGGFDGENEAIYIQDSYDVTDRLNVSLGWRRDQMSVANPLGETFMEFDDEQALPRRLLVRRLRRRHRQAVRVLRALLPADSVQNVVPDGRARLWTFRNSMSSDRARRTSRSIPAANRFTARRSPMSARRAGPCPTAPGITSPGADACVVRNPRCRAGRDRHHRSRPRLDIRRRVPDRLRAAVQRPVVGRRVADLPQAWSGGRRRGSRLCVDAILHQQRSQLGRSGLPVQRLGRVPDHQSGRGCDDPLVQPAAEWRRRRLLVRRGNRASPGPPRIYRPRLHLGPRMGWQVGSGRVLHPVAF
ncbi:MAG: carboxypeptidase regulatory-like domain-containing protein [Terricaulis sp.]